MIGAAPGGVRATRRGSLLLVSVGGRVPGRPHCFRLPAFRSTGHNVSSIRGRLLRALDASDQIKGWIHEALAEKGGERFEHASEAKEALLGKPVKPARAPKNLCDQGVVFTGKLPIPRVQAQAQARVRRGSDSGLRQRRHDTDRGRTAEPPTNRSGARHQVVRRPQAHTARAAHRDHQRETVHPTRGEWQSEEAPLSSLC